MSAPTENLNEENLGTLSDRLVFALQKRSINQAELARKIKVRPQAINYLCNKRATKSQLTYEIADVLNVNGDWLASGVGQMEPSNTDEGLKLQSRVPVVLIDEVIKQHPLNPLSWLFTTANTGEKGFAITLHDKSMYPRFDINTTVIVNPDKKPENKEFVIAYIHSADDVVFRQLESDGKNFILKPINTTMYKPITLTKDDKIMGVMVEARWQM